MPPALRDPLLRGKVGFRKADLTRWPIPSAVTCRVYHSHLRSGRPSQCFSRLPNISACWRPSQCFSRLPNISACFWRQA